MKIPTPRLLLLGLIVSVCAGTLPARAEMICAPKNAPRARIRATNGRAADDVHPAALGVLTCMLRGMEAQGLPIKTIWGYGCRPRLRSGAASYHTRGMAIDINQSARDTTFPTVPREASIKVAQSCGGVSGAQWWRPSDANKSPAKRSSDNGHFEMHSLSRAEQASRRPASSPQATVLRPVMATVTPTVAAPAAGQPAKQPAVPTDSGSGSGHFFFWQW
jgi:hypothetical protein